MKIDEVLGWKKIQYLDHTEYVRFVGVEAQCLSALPDYEQDGIALGAATEICKMRGLRWEIYSPAEDDDYWFYFLPRDSKWYYLGSEGHGKTLAQAIADAVEKME